MMSLLQRKFKAILPAPMMEPPVILISAIIIILCNAVAIGEAAAAPKINYRQKEKQILDQIFTADYDRNVRPSGSNGTAKVDARKLRYLTLTDSSLIWIPDLFFPNEKQGHVHNLIKPNEYVRIHPDGEVLYSMRISLTLSCPMILKWFPMDKQICSMGMASYGWTSEDIIFKWKKVDPVQVTSDLHLPRFALEQFTTDYCDTQTNTGIHSCLRLDLLFKRELSYYLIQIYIPFVMLVIVSWISFWLDVHAVTARVFLGVTTLLTMTLQTSGTNKTLPPVSCTKALDVWTGVCLAFVFGSLLEFALVQHVSRWDGIGRRQNGKKQCPKSHSERIDAVSRIAFPLIFAIFNIVYWSTYLGKDGNWMDKTSLL